MEFKHRERWLTLLVVVLLAFSLAACGAPPGDDTEATPTTGAGPDEPPASSTPTPTSTPSGVVTDAPPPTHTPTPTPTPAVVIHATSTPPAPASRCDGLSGKLEMQVLVGPADAAGMEPFAVGDAPFSVTTNEPPYLIQGGGPISYDDMITFEWGTYSVSLHMNTTITGECTGSEGSEALNLDMEATGEQLLVVDSPEFHGEYPWAGTNNFNLTFPLVNGASVEGEGYLFVLHLSGQ